MILKQPFPRIAQNPPISPNGSQIYISQKFGLNPQIYAQFGLNGHNGIDIAAPKNTPIKAVHSGWIIEQTSKETGYGLRICQRFISDNKNYLLVYGHMDHLELDQDMQWNWNDKSYWVEAGQVIGYVDSTGFSTGHHLHLGLYEYDQNGNKLNSNNGYGGAIDPLPFIKENVMEFYQIEGEQTLVVKNFTGKFYKLATTPDLYPYVAKIFGIEGKNFDPIPKATVENNLGGLAQAGITFIEK